MAMHDCDVMLCVGARFDDRITGNLKYFSPNSKNSYGFSKWGVYFYYYWK